MKTLIPILISLLSLLIAGFALWHTYLSPFNLQFNPGRPIFGKSPIGGKVDTFGTTPIIPIEFHNSGAKGGVLEDIIIVIENKKINGYCDHIFFAIFLEALP